MMIKKPSLLLSVIIVVSFGAAGLLTYFSESRDPYAWLAARMETAIQDTAAEVLTLMEDFSVEKPELPNQNPWLSGLLFRGDTLIYYTNNDLPLPTAQLLSLNAGQQGVFVAFDKRAMLAFSRSFPGSADSLRLMVLLTLYQKYPFTSPYLPESLVLDGRAQAPVAVPVSQPTPYPVRNKDGKVIFYLEKGSAPLVSATATIVFWLYLIGFVTLLIGLQRWSKHPKLQLQPFVSSLPLVLAILLIRYGMEATLIKLWTVPYQQAGRLLCDSLLTLWLLAFFHRHFRVSVTTAASFPYRLPLGMLQLLAIGSALVLFSRLLQAVAGEPQFDLDLDNIYAVQGPGLLALFSLLMLLLALFLFSHRLMLTFSILGLSLREKIAALMLALACSAPLVFYGFEGSAAWSVLLFLLLYLTLLEFFSEARTSGLTWIIIWLAFFAGFTAFYLYRFHLEKDLQQWQRYAATLVAAEDSLAEKGLQQLGDKLLQDTSILEYFNIPLPFDLAPEAVQKAIDPYYSADPYLLSHYNYEVHLLNEPFGVSLIRNQSADLALSLSTGKTTNSPDIFLPPPGQPRVALYWKKIFPTPGNPDSRNEVYLTLYPKPKRPVRVYQELLPPAPYKGLTDLDKFEYAVIRPPYTVLQSGTLPTTFLSQAVQLEPESFAVATDNQHKAVLYKNADQHIVIIGKTYGGGKKWLSLFSFLFAGALGGLFLILLLDPLLHLVPEGFYPEGFLQPSLRTRIQASILALILASFVIIAFVTITFFRNTSLAINQNNNQARFTEILAALRNEVARLPIPADSLSWNAAINAVADIHQVDIQVFDPLGRLRATTADYLFKGSIQASLMEPQALTRLQAGAEWVQLETNIGELPYQAAFAPVYTPSRDLHYIEMAVSPRANRQQSDIYTLIGTLVSTYVFLLLAAGAMGIFVTNSITRPLAKIGEKLQGLQIGRPNEPIEWDTRDELGDLIRQYNQMIGQLEESTRKLRQSEREGAWREMARQVAHEIKNPLTPMKLSIQHLLRVQQSDPEKAAALLQRVANTLIEQIDSLTRIATAFSNFAQMPKADNQAVNLNELLRKAFTLFEKNQSEHFRLLLSLPEDDCMVYGDKEHLVRVLNNLITNAIQAIPDDTAGEVAILLNTEVGNKIRLEIRDNGTGIPEEAREKVFAPYFTTKSSGTGLGLAMTRNIIEAMSGDIYFQTESGKGTSFFIVLPLMPADAEKD